MSKNRLFVLVSLFSISIPSAIAATNFDPEGHAKLPIIGTSCETPGATVKNSVFLFSCKSEGNDLVWTGSPLQYKTPSNYLKGYAIGQALKKVNADGSNDALICRHAADGYVVKNYQIQEGKVPATDRAILNEYYGLMGCWAGYSSTKPAAATINLSDPVGPIMSLKSGQLINIGDAVYGLFTETADAFDDSTSNGLEWIANSQVAGAFDSERTDSCSEQRLNSNWAITSFEPDLRTLSYSYGSDWRVNPEPDSEYDSGRITSDAYVNTPVKVFVWETYRDDINGNFGTGTWRRAVINEDGTLAYIVSPCAIEDEAEFPKVSTWLLPKAQKQIKAPTGKVDKGSNAYKTMYAVGKNFAKVSMASDTAKSQCLSAMATGMIRARGVPQYLGVQARQIQSFLSTASGYQGCIDGFGR